MNPRHPLAVCGSVNVDIVGYVDHLPRPGETLHARRTGTGLGGKGANQAAAIAKLGAPVVLIGRTGDDAFGGLARQKLAGFGVGLEHLEIDSFAATGTAMIEIDAAGENTIVVAGGANMTFVPSDLAPAREALAAAPVLLLQLEIPLPVVLTAATTARAGGARVILDPAPAPSGGLPDGALVAADLVTPNETETELLVGLRPTNAAEAAEAAERLIGRGVGGAIIKLGAHGVYFRGPDGEGFIPPFKVTAIDSVAAGDSFNGGLAVALASGRTLGEAVRFAAACGALATTRQGASEAAPTLAEVEALLAAQPG